MNEFQKVDQDTNVVTFNFSDPTQSEAMQRICKMLASSEPAPDIYKASDKNPIDKATANCMITISIAVRIGADPLMIMQNVTPIYSRPVWSSKFLIATVNTCGRFNPLQYGFTGLGRPGKVEYTIYNKIWTPGQNGDKGYYHNEAEVGIFDRAQIDNIQCIAYTTKEGSAGIFESTPVDVKLAVQEGWYTENGSKQQTVIRQMLTYRAASMWTNAYAPELSMGMKMVEEMHDIANAGYEDATGTVEKEKAENVNKDTINTDDAPTATDPAQPKDQPTDQGNNQNQPGNNAPRANGPGF